MNITKWVRRDRTQKWHKPIWPVMFMRIEFLCGGAALFDQTGLRFRLSPPTYDRCKSCNQKFKKVK